MSYHVMRKEKSKVVRMVIKMSVKGSKGRSRPKKRWLDAVKYDIMRTAV